MDETYVSVGIDIPLMEDLSLHVDDLYYTSAGNQVIALAAAVGLVDRGTCWEYAFHRDAVSEFGGRMSEDSLKCSKLMLCMPPLARERGREVFA